MDFHLCRSSCRLRIATRVLSQELRTQHRRPVSSATTIQEPRLVNDILPFPIHSPLPSPPPPHQTLARPLPRRRQNLKNAKPFSDLLTDTFSRQHDYLRVSITERCNLRCTYCMPEEGVPLSPASHLLTSPEITYLSALFVSQGVTKIRLTGGEPTIRKDIVPLMYEIGNLRSKGLRELCLTTNGIALHRKLDSMAEAGLTGVNLSLDTLDPFQFQIMTRRMGFEAVTRSIDRILEMNKLGARIKLKINCVVMRGVNEREIVPFVEMGREKDVEVRFIEYMPFDGNKWSRGKMLSYVEMLAMIRQKYPVLEKVKDHENDTSKTFRVPGFVGRIGFITSMTNNFCGSCNRLRITGDGNLKVCLFGNAEVSLRDILRKGNNGEPIDQAAMEAIKQVEMDNRQGLLAERGLQGYGAHERELLEVIGLAVKRKKEKHAGMGELENMKNRPMILIDETPSTRSQKTQSILTAKPTNAHPLGFGHRNLPLHLLTSTFVQKTTIRSISNTALEARSPDSPSTAPRPNALPHLTPTSEIHLISTSTKVTTHRVALAMGLVRFSNSETLALIRENSLKKGDVLAVARIAAIQAVKKTPDIIPLAHGGVAVEGCTVRLESVDAKGGPLDDVDDRLLRGIGHYGGVSIQVKVETTAKTGVEMEALTGVVGAALTVVDMCKGVDKECKITGIQVLGKMGGRSGAWGIFAEGERVRKVLSMKRSGRKLGSQAKQRMAVEERRKEKHENAPTKAIKKPKQQQAIKKKQLNKEALNATQIEEAPEDEETGEKKSRPTAEHIESIGRKIERRAPEAIGAEEDEPVEKIVWKKLSFENKSKESG